ncbi:10052_t:CDS:2 [Ambispora leptoticha]|uniref:10052_t:CDS:1 n=1 Tax=Ambispora leptoticha TaxID=144679 RepID=A0A9N9FP01_9GLOM|nr:10052_t:CDS:2 [Ambispora leptoticha]
MVLSSPLNERVLSKRCTPGAGRHDCNDGDPCDSKQDCANDVICNSGIYDINVISTLRAQLEKI